MLVKRITIDDLTDRDLEVYRAGFMVSLPFKDRARRPVFFYDCSNFDTRRFSFSNIERAWWYHYMTSFLEDDEAQLKGAVVINPFFGAGIKASGSMRLVLQVSSRVGYLMNSVMPGRLACFHACYDNPRLEFLVSTFRMALGLRTRLRIKGHLGSDIENEYDLTTYGIPCTGLIQGAREREKSWFMHYIDQRQEIDRSNTEELNWEATMNGFVPAPDSNDVLIGRGRPYRDFPGNEPWTDLIDSHLDIYRNCSTRFEKTCVTMDIVKMIRASSEVRFLLEATKGGWKILDDTEVRAKAAAAFQNRHKILCRIETSAEAAENAAKRRRMQ